MSRSPTRYRSRSRSPGGASSEANGTIFVGNLNPDTGEEDLSGFFQSFGGIKATKVIRDPESGRSRNFGFVTFEDPRDATDAIRDGDGKASFCFLSLQQSPNYMERTLQKVEALCQQILAGRALKCNMAKYPQGGGARGRGRGYGRGPPGGPGRYGNERGGRPFDRYSPDRYSPRAPYSPPRERPQRGRHEYPQEARGGAPDSYARGPPPEDRRPRARSASRSSYSSTDSDASRSPKRPARAAESPPPSASGRIAAGAAPAVRGLPMPPSDAMRKELAQVQRREGEMAARVAALEAEVMQARTSRGDQQAQLQELQELAQRNEEASKAQRKWLSALADCARAFVAGKAAVKAAQERLKLQEDDLEQRETDLALYLTEVDRFLNVEKTQRTSRKRLADRTLKEDAGGSGLEGGEDDRHPGDSTWSGANGSADVGEAANAFKPSIKFRLA